MAGSIDHCVEEQPDGSWRYRGTDLLENMGDMKEAVDQMMFVILAIREQWGGTLMIDPRIEQYFRCARHEEPWPEFMREGIEV